MNCDGEDVRGYTCAICMDGRAIDGERLCPECKQAKGDDDEEGASAQASQESAGDE